MEGSYMCVLVLGLCCVASVVWGQGFRCVPGWYGGQCNDTCQSSNCLNNQCDQTTGLCTDCAPGFYNLSSCTTSCQSTNCLNNQCDKTSGLCLSCPTNFDGHLCQGCKPGYHGAQCDPCSSIHYRCTQCTQDSTCTACSNNLQAPYCTDCRHGYYKSGTWCVQCNCRCKDRKCNHDTGRCDDCAQGQYKSGTTCSECNSWCKDGKCNRDIGKCNGCKDGRWGPQCGTPCYGSCGQCTQDTGTCKECLEGYYKRYSWSTSCTECTWQCLDNTVCNNTTGDCAHCPLGKMGNRCDQACSPGRYGPSRCAETCGQCKGGRCDAVTGHCAQCQPGWQAPLCKTPCAPHMYGENCSERCGHCKGEQPCNASTGECTGECQPGYTGTLCKTECGAGLYGAECNQTCGHCQVNTTCHHEDGHCLVGCVAEFAGPLCLQGCRPGYHGQQCDESCSTIADQCVQCTQSGQCTACSGHFQLPQCTGSDQSRLAVVSGILGAGLMVTIAVLVFLCWRFRSQLIVQKQDTLASVYADPITAGSNAYTEPPSVALSPPDEACGNTQHEIRDPGNPYEQLRVYSNMMFDREAHSDPEPRGTDVTTPKSTSEYVNVTLEHIYANMSSGPKTKKKPRKKKAK